MKPQNHETYQHLAVQRWSEQNHETYLHLAVSVHQWRDKHGEISHETMKPWVLFSKMCHDLFS